MRYCGSGLAVAAAGLLALTAGSASASTFDYNGYSVVDEINVTISGSPGQNGYFGSGQIDLNGKNGVLATWCLDVFDDLQGSGSYNIVSSGFTDDGGRPGSTPIAASTMEDIGSLIHWGDNHLDANIHHLGSGLVSAAVQLAIWTIEYSGTPGAKFTSDNSNVNKLVKWLVHQAEEAGNGKLGAFTGNLEEVIDPFNNQGLIFEVDGSNSPALTPLPSTWTMLIAGFLGFGFLAYRGRKTRSAATAAA